MPNKLVTMLGGFVLAASVVGSAVAGNPIIKERFTADPATLVHDGVVYLYVGHDEAKEDGDFPGLGTLNMRKRVPCFP